MRKYTFLFLLSLWLIPIAASSQDIQTATIEWNCATTFIPRTGDISNDNTRVVSSPTQITWYDANGNIKQTFNIIASVGSWTNVSVNGSILFRADSGDKVSVVRFEKSGSARRVSISIDLESEPTVYELTVNQVNTL